MAAKTIENKVNLVWKNVCPRNKFPPFVTKSVATSNTDLPKFYHLIKTHKTGAGIKIRQSIVSNIKGPTQRISRLLSRALEHMLKNVPAYLGNSYELIKCIQDGDSNNRKQGSTILVQPACCAPVHIHAYPRSHRTTLLTRLNTAHTISPGTIS